MRCAKRPAAAASVSATASSGATVAAARCQARRSPRGAVRGLQGGGERGVGAAALLGARAAVHERAQQRMAEAQAVLGRGDHARALGLGERVGRQPELRRGVEDDVRAVGLARGGEHERVPRGLGELGEPALERVRDQPPGRQRLAEPDAAGEPVVADRGGDLQRGERVAVGRARDARDEVAAEGPFGRTGHERRDRVLSQAAQREPLEAATGGSSPRPRRGRRRGWRPAVADPPRRERERLQRRAVDPLRVVDAHEHGRVGGRPPAGRARPRRPRSAPPPRRTSRARRAARPPAVRAARRSAPSTGWSSSWIPENGSSASCSAPAARRRRTSPARPATASSSADLPTPGSPVSTRTPPSAPARAPANTASMRSSSASRPTSTARALLAQRRRAGRVRRMSHEPAKRSSGSTTTALDELVARWTSSRSPTPFPRGAPGVGVAGDARGGRHRGPAVHMALDRVEVVVLDANMLELRMPVDTASASW